MTQYPKTLLEAITYFSNEAVCVTFLSKYRWSDGIPVCPHCGSKNVASLTSRPAYRCREKNCKKGFSLKTGSIMEDSPLPITKWVPAIWFVINHKNGVSSCEVARALGITQKSAWFMCHRIREAIQTAKIEKLKGAVECDETYIGGKEYFKHRNNIPSSFRVRGHKNKSAVMGMLERGGVVGAQVVNSDGLKVLEPVVIENIEEGSMLVTDQLGTYKLISQRNNYKHESVSHSTKEYVRGHIHTNTLEGFWNLFKRSVKGTYTQIAPFHIDRYLDEQVFRYNNRKTSDFGRFEQAVSQMFGKRLTYAELTGVVQA